MDAWHWGDFGQEMGPGTTHSSRPFSSVNHIRFFWGVPTCLKAQIIPSPKDRLGEVVDTQILLAAG